jgi:hypothetical protein
MRNNSFVADGVESDLPSGRRVTRDAFARARAHNEALATRHQPLDHFTPGQRVVITAPTGGHRPYGGRDGVVLHVNPTGSAWVRLGMPAGAITDHCFSPDECSAEVNNG